MNARLLRLKDVETRTGLKRSTIYSLIQQGEFPRQIAITERCVGWLEDEIHDFILKRLEAARGKQVA